MAEQAERISQQQQSQGNAFGAGAASFAADLNRAGAGFDLLYAQSQSVKAGVQQTWRDVQLVRQNGLVAGGKQAIKEHATLVGGALPVVGNVMRGNEARRRGDYLSATGYYMGAGGDVILSFLAIRAVASSPKTSGGTPPVIATDPTPAPTQAAIGEGGLVLEHGTTRLRAQRMLGNGPDPAFVEPGGSAPAGGLSTARAEGPFPLGTPDAYAQGKAAIFPNEGGPAVLRLEVPPEIVSKAIRVQGEVRFEPGYGLLELQQQWKGLPKQIRDTPSNTRL